MKQAHVSIIGKRVGSAWDLVGDTPLIFLPSISRATGCKIFGKAEFLNPGGSVKDRAAKGIIQDAEKRGLLKPGGVIVEGTAGNTGIGLSVLGVARGYKVIIAMPDNQSPEKYELLEVLGAEIRKFKPVPFSNPENYYHQARQIAETTPGAFWANQFENVANGEFHYQTTGPEIWSQTEGTIDIFTCSVGSSGTLSGVSRFLKEKNPGVKVVVADPFGSGMYAHTKSGKIETEGSSITEGIGIMRVTENFKQSCVDDAIRVSDQEMIDMVYHIAHEDGLFLGTSSGINMTAAYRLAQEHAGSEKTIVTILCDSGTRYSSRIANRQWLESQNLVPRKLTMTIA